MRKLICICILTAVFLSALTGCGNKVVDNDIEKPNEEDVRSLIDYKDSPNIWGDVYDITDFGGKNDNETDNYQAILDAVSYVAANGGGTIYFPAGTYLVKQSIVLDNETAEKIILAGDTHPSTRTVIKSDASVDGDFITIAGDNISLAHMLVWHSGPSGSAIQLKADNSYLSYIKVNQTNAKNKEAAITVSGSNNYIGNSTFGSGSARGYYIVRFTKVAGKEAENNTLADCYIGEGAPYSVLVDTDEEGNCPKNITIARNVILCRVVGQVYIKAVDGCKVLNNMLDCTSTSVILNPSPTGIKNVEIRYNYMAQTGDLYNNDGFENRTDSKGGVVTDIKGGGSIQNVTISDNYFWGCYYGVRVTSSKFTDFTIYNNQFVQSVGGSIYITDSVRNTIESNFIQSHPEMGMYNIYIGNNDDETMIRNNVIWNRGRPSNIPNWEKYEDLNVVFD